MKLQERQFKVQSSGLVKTLRIGSRVSYDLSAGRKPLVFGTVTAIYEDVKHGEPGFDALREDGDGENWVYGHQLYEVYS